MANTGAYLKESDMKYGRPQSREAVQAYWKVSTAWNNPSPKTSMTVMDALKTLNFAKDNGGPQVVMRATALIDQIVRRNHDTTTEAKTYVPGSATQR